MEKQDVFNLLASLEVEDKDDFFLALLFWCLAHFGKASVPPEVARLN
jgi:hypothetical protein